MILGVFQRERLFRVLGLWLDGELHVFRLGVNGDSDASFGLVGVHGMSLSPEAAVV